MLEYIRHHKNLFSILFVISGSALIISMFSRPGQNTGSSLSGVVAARVDGDEISVNTLYSAVRRQREQLQDNIEDQVAKSENKAETRKFMDQLLRSQVSPDRVLAELVNEKFMIRESEIVGLDVPPVAVIDILRQEPYFQKDGKFDALRYKQVVAQPGIYEQELRQRAKQIAMNRAVLSSLSFMSPEEEKIEALLKKKSHFELLSLSPSKFQDLPKPTEKETQAFAQDPAQSSKIQNYYDRNINKYKKGEEVHARHILIKDDAGGEKKAAEILADIKNKKITFAEAAKKYSSDKSNADKGGDLGFFGKGRMDPAFESASFALKKDGDLVDKPVKSSFGYHLIERVAAKSAESKSLVDAKNSIAEELIADARRADKARTYAKSIVDSGKSPSDADLKKLGLSWSAVSWSPLDSSLGALGSVDTIRSKLMTLSGSNPLLKEVVPQAENFVVVRWTAPKKGDEEKPADETPSKLAQDKAYSAMQFFLKGAREKLEKAKKIVRNDSAVAQVKQTLGDMEASPFGR